MQDSIVKYVEGLTKTKRCGFIIQAKIDSECDKVKSMVTVLVDNNLECDYKTFSSKTLEFNVYSALKQKGLFNSKETVKDPLLTTFKNEFSTLENAFRVTHQDQKFRAEINDKELSFNKLQMIGNSWVMWVYNSKKENYFAYTVTLATNVLKMQDFLSGSKDTTPLDILTAIKLKKTFPDVLENADIKPK